MTQIFKRGHSPAGLDGNLVLQLRICYKYDSLGWKPAGGMGMSVAEWSGATLKWEEELSALKARLAPAFGRSEVRASAGAFIDGLLSGISRKTGWLMAEQAGLDRPYRMQSLLGRSSWDAERLRDAVRDEVMAVLGDPGGVLVVDETGFLKKGRHSVGVTRQYSGTAGRVENCQIGVFLAYASRLGQALIDRRLYLPEAWAGAAARRQQVQVPESIAFATKPQIACDLISAALDTGVPCAWVLADALYGSDSRLRRMLEARHQPYVLAVRSNQTLRMPVAEGLLQTNPAELADALPAEAWHAHPAGEGSKGIRLYDWARIALPWVVDDGFERWVLIRRSRQDSQARAYYLVFAPVATTLAELAGAAGLRWTIEECFQRAKEELGLDHCEARSWHGWHRHMTLCMAAAAFLARLAAQLRHAAASKANERSPRSRAA
jgi:SRSO17 transposase